MKQILFIDDNEDVLSQIGKYLKLKGYDVTGTTSGRNGLELLSKSKFDYMILDLAMPDFSGFDVIKQIDKSLLKNLTLIVLTASQITELMRDRLHQQNITILEKPILLDELITVLESSKK